MAAVLAAGPGAVCSHRAGGAHWQIWRSEYIDVTLERRRRQLQGIRVHQLPLPPDEITLERGVPVTTVPRTLFDLASVLARRHVERAINEAEIRRLYDRLSLADLLERYPNRRGASTVREIVDDGVVVTHSDLEVAFLAFVEERVLPFPEVNPDLFVGGQWFRPDCLWRRERVIVELDGRAIHGTGAAFERDRIRDRRLQVGGWRVIRVTASQLRRDRDRLAYELRALLSSSPATAPSRRTSHVPSAS
jgi:hypothetical protein